jgi:hypothetical protein
MQMETLRAPLRVSRAALAPYVERMQDGYIDARAKMQHLALHSPKTRHLLQNRYFLLSLAAGACLFAMRRYRLWREQHVRSAPRKRTRAASASTRKSNRGPARGARVH